MIAGSIPSGLVGRPPTYPLAAGTLISDGAAHGRRSGPCPAAIATYEAEMFARMQHMTEGTLINTEMFYAPDASDRVVALFRSFGGSGAVPPASEA